MAELASALPTSANVYHWASVTAGPKHGKIVSFYAGWWNCLAWIFGAANVSLFAANTVIAMYSVYHPDYVPQRWQTFICFLIITWADLSVLLFGQRFVAKGFTGIGVLLMLIWAITTLVCAIMPSQTDAGYASNSFVWADFANLTGWSSDGLVFVMGILNGAYAIGTPCAVAHLAEEVCVHMTSAVHSRMLIIYSGAKSAKEHPYRHTGSNDGRDHLHLRLLHLAGKPLIISVSVHILITHNSCTA